MVAAVLAVLNVLAITSSAPRRNRKGDIPRTRNRTVRYQTFWQARPSKHDDDQPDQRLEDVQPFLLADARRHDPEDGQRHQRDDPEQDPHQQLETDAEEVDHDPVARLPALDLLVADLREADRQGEREQDELRQVVLGEGVADAPGDQLGDQVGDASSRASGFGVTAQVDQVGPPAGLDQVREGQADAHGDQRVDQVIEHHQEPLAAPDVVRHDRVQDRQHDQRGGQGAQGPDDQRGEQVERVRPALASRARPAPPGPTAASTQT